MKRRLLSVLLAAIFCLCGATAAFADLDYSQWDSNSRYPEDVIGTKLFAPVKYLVDNKIITGDSDGLFHPEKNITRAEFTTMMVKATRNDKDLDSAEKQEIFSDLSGYEWAKGYINAGSKAGLVNGIGGGKFAPEKDVTYAEVITLIIRMNQGAVSAAESMSHRWPDNYISYAETYNMKGDVLITDWNAPANKGDAAKLLYRSMPKSADAED